MAIKPNIKFKERTPNWELLNAIREDASHPYQERVPAATKADAQTTINKLLKYAPARNEFIDALVNQIGLVKFTSDSYFQNPLAKFKQGMLENGDTVEEIGTGLLNAYTYNAREDVGEKELFGQEDIEAQTSFHRINRQEKYKVTIQESMLKRAFATEYGISELVGRIMDMPTKTNQVHEYTHMANLFRTADRMDAFYRIHTPDVSAVNSTEADAKGALRVMRQFAGTVPFVSRKYNAAHLPVSAAPEDLELFITPEASAALDVNGLAALFNIERGQVPYRQTLIEESFFPEGVWAILTTKDFFQVYDTLMETRSLQNPGGLYDNYWLHVHQIISLSRFVPLVAFTTGPGTEENDIATPVTSVEDITIYDHNGDLLAADAELARGSYYRTVSSAVTTPEGGSNNAVRWSVAGFTDDQSFIDQRGTLYPSPFERADTIVITATATDNETISVVKGAKLSGEIISLWNPIDILPDPA